MNLILLFQEDFTGRPGRVILRGRRLDHVLNIHRATAGDSLCVGLLNGCIGMGVITHIESDVLEMDVYLEKEPPPPLDIILVLALPRPIVLKRVLLAVSSLGVKRIILLNSKRVEKSYWNSPALSEENIREQLILGLEQARDTVLPEVLLRTLFRPFVEDELPHLIKGTLPIVAHPEALEPCPRDISSPMTLAIGPEGGFIPYEVEMLQKCGFRAVQIGERILRVETAVPVLISRLK